MKAFRGFKRFDDENSRHNERKVKASSSRRRKKTDQSALPILNFEDSGLSPVNSPRRWDALYDENQPEIVDVFELNSKQESSVPSSFDFISATKKSTKSKSDKVLAEKNNNITPSKNAAAMATNAHVKDGAKQRQQCRSNPKSETVEDVFDPFRLDDLDVQPSQKDISLTQDTDFDFKSDDWKEFRSEGDDVLIFNSTEKGVGSSLDHKELEAPSTSNLEEDGDEKRISSKHIKGARQSFLSKNDDGLSISSFPMRIKPIEFLKQNRNDDAKDDYADDIFLKIDQSAHMRCPNGKRTPVSETLHEDASSDCTCATPQIQPVETGIEVIDAETVASLEKQQSHERQAGEQQQDTESAEENNTMTELLSPAFGGADVKTPKDQTRPTRRKSTLFQAGKAASADHNEAPEERASPSEEMSDDKECSEKDESHLSEALAKLVGPVLNPGSVSLKDDNPIKLAAERLGISLSEDKNCNDSLAERSTCIKVPLSVKIKQKKPTFAQTRKEINAKHSIHLENENAGSRKRHAIPQCDSSLLDSVTEISDFQSMSTQSSVNPRKHLQTIDTKTVNSRGSISALSFLGQPVSEKLEDDASSKGDILSIPRGPTRRTESDFASIDEEPVIPPKTEKKRYKPLGASANEIRGINTFLAIAGPDFDGARLSIEEREQLFKKAFKAGMTENFINKMLDQSAGILLWEQQSAISEESQLTEEMSARTHTPSTRAGRTTRCGKGNCDDSTKVTMMSSYSEDLTYDEEGFTRKTPKEDTFSCLKNIFWMESSNVVGDDMTENLMAVLSQDSESLYSRRKRPER